MTQTTPSSVDAMRLRMFLEILSAMGGKSDAGDYIGNWITAFCGDHEGQDPDTFNRAIDLGYAGSSHDSDTDAALVWITDAGRAALSTLPSDGVTIPADDGGEAITDAAKRMVAVQGMDWAELDGGDIGYWESLAAVALAAAPKAPPVAQAEGVERLALEAIKAVTATTKDAVAGLSRIMAIARSAGVAEPYSELMAKPDVQLIVSRPRTEWRHLFEQSVECAIPPAGCRCTRTPGHDGPCAVVPAPSGATQWEGQ
ncbi:hypothetical protein [Sphingomonas sp. CCH9-F2]|jgi:hypothetical protein|uniref:hypothetical protein n=1 Tax=Sphingomonas sp. CCH9-F2 TaxID=1768778 RepID=UPI000ACCDC58|nr:hypothetical protein [Sphingomonas sp. CCH9-F2]